MISTVLVIAGSRPGLALFYGGSSPAKAYAVRAHAKSVVFLNDLRAVGRVRLAWQRWEKGLIWGNLSKLFLKGVTPASGGHVHGQREDS
jgi:ammonia channel protein AmtB